jgi:hypothetical protein
MINVVRMEEEEGHVVSQEMVIKADGAQSSHVALASERPVGRREYRHASLLDPSFPLWLNKLHGSMDASEAVRYHPEHASYS